MAFLRAFNPRDDESSWSRLLTFRLEFPRGEQMSPDCQGSRVGLNKVSGPFRAVFQHVLRQHFYPCVRCSSRLTRTFLPMVLACLFTGGVFGKALVEYSESLSSSNREAHTPVQASYHYFCCPVSRAAFQGSKSAQFSLFPALFGDFFSRPPGPSVGPFVHELIAE